MKRYCSMITIALLSCLFVYTVYRPEHTVINIMLDHMTGNRATGIRQALRSHIPLPAWVIFSLPEGLWIFSATLISRRLYCRLGSFDLQLSWMPVVYGVLLELLQLGHIMPGRFDIMDILMAVGFSLLATYRVSCPLPPQYLFRTFNYRTFFLVYSYGIVFLSHVQVTGGR